MTKDGEIQFCQQYRRTLMREKTLINDNWLFSESHDFENAEKIHIPHTWNAIDGQDGGGDYFRGERYYLRKFVSPELKENEELYIEFEAVNSMAKVYINGHEVVHHEGGYSKFRANITSRLKQENEILVEASNAVTNHVYPEFADFTFYGGIYRDVYLIKVNKVHFDLDYLGGNGIQADPIVKNGKATLTVKMFHKEGEGRWILLDKEGKEVAKGKEGETIEIPSCHLWNGIPDPYLYTLRNELVYEGEVVDVVIDKIGFREFHIDPKLGFFLNGKSYPLRGVSRHQDRLGKGNAISKEDQDEDMALIREIGATTIRLAHYQHSDYFYSLCDENGLIIWSEIPYISKHIDMSDNNAESQMKELIVQTYNHPSIVVRGLSNEITMKKAGKDRLYFHKKLNAMVHEMDPHRLTVMAGFAAIGAFNPLNTIPDVFSYNFYFGWYAPFTWLNNVRLGFYHFTHPKHPIGLSEYGAEAMTNLHSSHPRRFDNTEEYASIYHEKMLKIFKPRDYLWATHVWNMFDFGADGRNQGGDPGKNHKGLVTFDRKIKKDAFYIYKAYWTKDPFVHICGRRYVNRPEGTTKVKVYSNLPEVELFVNGKSVGKKTGDKVFVFKVLNVGESLIEAKAGDYKDSIKIKKVATKDPSYENHSGSSYSWETKRATEANDEIGEKK